MLRLLAVFVAFGVVTTALLCGYALIIWLLLNILEEDEG